jgi:hypothetical protein
MIECKLTKSGFLQIFVSEEDSSRVPSSAHIKCSKSDLESLAKVLKDALDQILEYHKKDEFSDNAVVFCEGGSSVVIYPPTQTAVLIIKGVSMNMSCNALKKVYNRLWEVGI